MLVIIFKYKILESFAQDFNDRLSARFQIDSYDSDWL